MQLQYLAPAAVILCMGTLPAFATTTLAPGASVNIGNYLDYEIAAGDPTYFETLLDTVVVSVNETRDGFAAGEVVPGLYDVTAELTAQVWRGSTGLISFGYQLAAFDFSFAGLANGAIGFSVDGFADYAVEYGYVLNSGFPYVPSNIDRSADGDTLGVTYLDPRDPGPLIETFVFVTDATSYQLSGTGSIDIVIDTFGTTASAVSGLPVPATVPVPAGLPLILMGLGAFGLIRRRTQ